MKIPERPKSTIPFIGRFTNNRWVKGALWPLEKLTAGKLLEFDNRTESFADNAKATALLRREYRAPFVVPEKV